MSSPSGDLGGSDKPLGWTGIGFSVALCVPLLPAVGAVLAIIAVARNRFRPRWVAVVALVLGVACTGLQVAAAPGVVDGLRDAMEEAQAERDDVDVERIDTTELEKGDCFNDPNFRSGEDADVASVVRVPCDEAHDAEVFATVRVPGTTYPGEAVMDRRAERCLALFEDFVGVHYAASAHDLYFYFPTSQSWLMDDREIQCTIGDPDGRVTGTLAGIGRGEEPAPGDELTVEQLVVGDCFDQADDVLVVRSCKAPHYAEVFATVNLKGGAEFPGDAEVERRTVDRCTAVFRTFVGIPYDDSRLIFAYWTPTAQTWPEGDRLSICAAHEEDDSPMRGTVEGTRR